MLALACGFSLVFLAFPAFVRVFLVDPALQLFLLLDALPQGILWTLLLLLLSFLGLRLIRRLSRARPPQPKKTTPEVSRARELSALLRRTRYSPWAKRALRQRVARLAVSLRVGRERLSPSQAWQELQSGRWPGDGALGRFLRGEDSPDFLSSLGQALDELERYAQGGELCL